MTHLRDLPTPCLVLDRARLERNCARMSARASAFGVALRQHVKTAKSVEVARIAAGADESASIAVSTLREAEHFFAHGFGDLTYAVGITPDKLARCAALIRRGARLRVITDDVGVAREIARAADVHDVVLEVLIELDVGQHRCGVPADGEALLAIAAALSASPRARAVGVLAHAGHSYDARGAAALRAIAEDERRLAVHASERLRAAGHEAPVVSIGSTPTATHAEHLRGATELRVGVYVFGDLFQAAIGSCAVDDIALSVLTTVIALRPEERAVVIDAGALALSKDRSLDEIGGGGFGEARDLRGGALPGRPRVVRVSQEHGTVVLPAKLDGLSVGARLRILPNHACLTAAAHERYHVVSTDAERAEETWSRVNGW